MPSAKVSHVQGCVRCERPFNHGHRFLLVSLENVCTTAVLVIKENSNVHPHGTPKTIKSGMASRLYKEQAK